LEKIETKPIGLASEVPVVGVGGEPVEGGFAD